MRWHSVTGTALSAAARLSRLRPLPRSPGALGSSASLSHASLSRRSSQTLAMPASWIPALFLGGYAPSPPRPHGRRLQPPSCPFSAGAWLLLLLLPRLARAEGAGELDTGGGGREDREGGKEAEDLWRDAGLEWRRGARFHPLCTKGPTRSPSRAHALVPSYWLGNTGLSQPTDGAPQVPIPTSPITLLCVCRTVTPMEAPSAVLIALWKPQKSWFHV